jgi:hypothetical protein
MPQAEFEEEEGEVRLSFTSPVESPEDPARRQIPTTFAAGLIM